LPCPSLPPLRPLSPPPPSQILTTIGFSPSSDELDAALNIFDSDYNSAINYHEFMNFVQGRDKVKGGRGDCGKGVHAGKGCVRCEWQAV
jgi:hypothetical protein